jgi:[ribosomal protein S18]-alanine N-acetyltransferase
LGAKFWGVGKPEPRNPKFETCAAGTGIQFPCQRPEHNAPHQLPAMTIRLCNDGDRASIFAIQSKCPQAAQWRLEDYRQLGRDSLGIILVAEINNEHLPVLAGFAAFHRVLDEAELRNMAVDPEHQRKGIARALLAEGIRTLAIQGVSRLFLEVRASNQPAISLYRSADFRLMNTRRNYYHDPDEDAWVMACNMTLSSGAAQSET